MPDYNSNIDNSPIDRVVFVTEAEASTPVNYDSGISNNPVLRVLKVDSNGNAV